MENALTKMFRKEEKRKKMNVAEILKKIDRESLFDLCERFDKEHGEYPEHRFEGAALFVFFEGMREEVEGRMKG